MALVDRIIRIQVLDRNDRSIPNAKVYLYINEKLTATATAGTGPNGTIYTVQIGATSSAIALGADYLDRGQLKTKPPEKIAADVTEWEFKFEDVEIDIPPPQLPPEPERPFLWAGFICAAVALIFFIVLTLLPSFGHDLKCSQHFPAIVVLALAAGLATGFLGGDAKATGKIPLSQNLTPVEFAAAGGVATIIIILALGWFLYVKDCHDPNSPPVVPPKGAGTTSTETTATTSTGTRERARKPSEAAFATARESLGRIDDYLSTLEAMDAEPEQVIARNAPFFGPIDRGRVAAERQRWQSTRTRLDTLINQCQGGRADCTDATLTAITAPDAAPPEGKIFNIYTPRTERTIDLKSNVETVLFAAGEYQRSVTIMVRGEWVGRWFSGNDDSRCVDTIAQYLRFHSGNTTFTLPDDLHAGRRNRIAHHYVRSLSSMRGTYQSNDMFLLAGWPSDRSVSVSFVDPYGYTNNQICPKDLPRVLVWQPDARFETRDITEARFYW